MSNNTNAAKIQISQFLFPAGFGLESALARLLAMWFGHNLFDGVNDASVAYTEGQVIGTDAEFDGRHILPISCGHGRFGTPHPAITMAEKIGISTRPSMVPLLNAFVKRQGSQLRLEVLFRAFRRMTNAEGPFETVTFMSNLLDAIITLRECNYTATEGERTLKDIATQLIEAGHFPEKKIQDFMMREVEKSMGADPVNAVTELFYVVKALYRKQDTSGKTSKPEYTPDQIVEWVHKLLLAFYQQQVDYWKAVDEVKAVKHILLPACLGKWRGKLKLVVVKSDNDQIKKAAMSDACGNADVVLHEEITSGYRHIFFNPARKGLNGEDLCRMMEWTESPNNAKNKLKWSLRGGFGQESGVTHWCVDRNGNIHNGVKYSPQKLSNMENAQIIAMMKHAFHFAELKWWCNSFDITISDNPQPARSRPAPVVKRDNKPALPPTAPAGTEQVMAGNGDMGEVLERVSDKLAAAGLVKPPTPTEGSPSTPVAVKVTATEQPAPAKKHAKKKGAKPGQEGAKSGRPVKGQHRTADDEAAAEMRESLLVPASSTAP